MIDQLESFYQRARFIKTGKHTLHPIHQRLVEWTTNLLQSSVIDFGFYCMKTFDGTKHQCITIMLDKISDAKNANTTQNIEAISAEFMKFFLSENPVPDKKDKLKNQVYDAAIKPYPSVLVGFESLEEYELKKAIDAMVVDPEYTEKYKDLIWRIDNNRAYDRVVFYYTEAQVKYGLQSGTTQHILEHLLSLLKKHDTFNYFGLYNLNPVVDSKEMYDRQFGNDWSYYR